jgi:hypothetical protein
MGIPILFPTRIAKVSSFQVSTAILEVWVAHLAPASSSGPDCRAGAICHDTGQDIAIFLIKILIIRPKILPHDDIIGPYTMISTCDTTS